MGHEIFISYSREDKATVLPYVKQISEAVGKKCWIDLNGIESGVEFEEVIIKAIDECQVVLFMLSDSSLLSKWTKREVIYAEDEGKRIVPVLVDGDRLRGWFKFHFGNTDFIDLRSEEQKEKLVNNLKTWLGVEEKKARLMDDECVKRKVDDTADGISIVDFLSNPILPIGSYLKGGKYRISRHLPHGAFGYMYQAVDYYGKPVAIKEFFIENVCQRENKTMNVVASNLNLFQEQIAEFKKTTKLIQRVQNEHIVAILDMFDELGTSYYVMDYIDGITLHDLVKKRGTLSEQEVLNYLKQTLNALEEIHVKRIIHLDVKPANLMVDKTGRLRLIDFAVCKDLSSDEFDGYMAYTPGYAPNEQVYQEFGHIGPWTDLYALGATLYNLLTGNKPPLPSQIFDLEEEAFTFPPTISLEMRNLITWMMKVHWKKRPQSVKQVRDYISL